MKDFVTKDIMAIVPTYIADRGNCTIIYAEDENITTNSSVRNIVKRLCTHYHLDKTASNKYSSLYLYCWLYYTTNVSSMSIGKMEFF